MNREILFRVISFDRAEPDGFRSIKDIVETTICDNDRPNLHMGNYHWGFVEVQQEDTQDIVVEIFPSDHYSKFLERSHQLTIKFEDMNFGKRGWRQALNRKIDAFIKTVHTNEM